MNNWDELIVHTSSTLRSAMEIIDKNGLQTALVNSAEGTFIGTLTDGDIRRAILAGATLADAIDPFVNRNPITIMSMDDHQLALDAMERLALRCVPIIRNARIVGLLSQNMTTPTRSFDNPVLIMAGGRGERLRPLTNSTPKPLIKVGGKTLLEILLGMMTRTTTTTTKMKIFQKKTVLILILMKRKKSFMMKQLKGGNTLTKLTTLTVKTKISNPERDISITLHIIIGILEIKIHY
jgi:hypothetical protein